MAFLNEQKKIEKHIREKKTHFSMKFFNQRSSIASLSFLPIINTYAQFASFRMTDDIIKNMCEMCILTYLSSDSNDS